MILEINMNLNLLLQSSLVFLPETTSGYLQRGSTGPERGEGWALDDNMQLPSATLHMHDQIVSSALNVTENRKPLKLIKPEKCCGTQSECKFTCCEDSTRPSLETKRGKKIGLVMCQVKKTSAVVATSKRERDRN